VESNVSSQAGDGWWFYLQEIICVLEENKCLQWLLDTCKEKVLFSKVYYHLVAVAFLHFSKR
jgi:hypothetical protein